MKLKEVKELKELLERHNKDSRKYLDEFYKQCQNDEIEDMNWVESDNEFDDFINQQGVEYNRIYDKAIVDITSKLLILLNK